MSAQIASYTNPQSRGAIARWMTGETGIPFEQHVLAFGPPMKGEEYRKINPMGKVPARVAARPACKAARDKDAALIAAARKQG